MEHQQAWKEAIPQIKDVPSEPNEDAAASGDDAPAPRDGAAERRAIPAGYGSDGGFADADGTAATGDADADAASDEDDDAEEDAAA